MRKKSKKNKEYRVYFIEQHQKSYIVSASNAAEAKRKTRKKFGKIVIKETELRK